ncbi:2-Hydroxyacid oxidase 1-like [Glandiceps talaboti]
MADKMLCVHDYERVFQDHLHPAAWAYITTGSNDEEITLTQNMEAYSRLRIRPRMLRDVSSRDLSTSLLGDKIDFPVGISPSAFHRLSHPEGEVATAKASKAMNTCMILSLQSNTPLEKVAEETPDGLKWANLYLFRNREVTRDMVKRIESNHYKGIVVTIDNPSGGNRMRTRRLSLADTEKILAPNFGTGSLQKYSKDIYSNALSYDKVFGKTVRDAGATWEYIDWLRSLTSLPIILKGILTSEDAMLAVQHSANAVLVSNHGGRSVDGSPATIEALPEIARAVGDKIEVYCDGGIRTGNDVFKALALGAKAVFIGRPAVYGLAHSGEKGVRHILEILKQELAKTMADSGCCCLSDIKPSFVVHESYYAKL